MIVEIIKRHPVGIEVGVIKDVKTHIAYNLIEEGYAVESTREKLDEYKKQLKDEKDIESAKNRASIVEKISAEKAERIANQEKKNSDEAVKHAVSDIEAVKSEYFAKGIELGTSNVMKEGFAKGYELGHAGGYKQGYDICLAEMADKIFTEPEAEPEAEPEITGSQTEIEQEITVNEPESELEDDKISDLPELQNVEETETLTVQAEPAKPKRGKPATK